MFSCNRILVQWQTLTDNENKKKYEKKKKDVSVNKHF